MTIISTRPESWTSPFAITIQERSSSVTRVAFIPILQASPRAAQDVSRRRRVRDGCYTRSREPARSPPRAHGGRDQRAVPARRARVRRGPPHERGDRRPRPRPGQRPHRRPRAGSQQFAGLAPWEIIASVVDAVAIPVTGNGDVRSHDDARAMVRATGCAAVMIGRGALGAPWIFTPGAVSRAEKAQIIHRHARLIEAHLESRTALVQLKKHLAWYANGLPFAARIRAELFAAPSAAAVRDAFWRLW